MNFKKIFLLFALILLTGTNGAAVFREPTIYFLFVLIAGVFIVIRHKENLARLKAGRENKI